MLLNITEKSYAPMEWANHTHGVDGQLMSEWSRMICYQLLGFPISLFGVVGNIMSIHIWTQKEMQWGLSSTSWYLVALSCSDVLYLLTLNFGLLLPGWKKLNNGLLEPMFDHSETVERLQSIAQPMSDTFVNISIYLVVAFTLERFIAVTYPIKGRVLCTPKRARFVILVLIAAVVVLHIPGFLEHDPIMKRRGYEKQTWYRIGYNWGVMVLIFAVLPIFALSFFNSMLIRRVHVSQRERRTLTMSHKQRHNEGKSSEKFTVVTMTVILVVIIFFICHTPAAVILCIYTYKSQFYQLDERALYRWSTASSIANLLSVINSSVNFLLYSIFSSKFRKTCTKMYCRWWCCRSPVSRESTAYDQSMYGVPASRQHDDTTENGTAKPLLLDSRPCAHEKKEKRFWSCNFAK